MSAVIVVPSFPIPLVHPRFALSESLGSLSFLTDDGYPPSQRLVHVPWYSDAEVSLRQGPKRANDNHSIP